MNFFFYCYKINVIFTGDAIKIKMIPRDLLYNSTSAKTISEKNVQSISMQNLYTPLVNHPKLFASLCYSPQITIG